jgi:hypothetical protein
VPYLYFLRIPILFALILPLLPLVGLWIGGETNLMIGGFFDLTSSGFPNNVPATGGKMPVTRAWALSAVFAVSFTAGITGSFQLGSPDALPRCMNSALAAFQTAQSPKKLPRYGRT